MDSDSVFISLYYSSIIVSNGRLQNLAAIANNIVFHTQLPDFAHITKLYIYVHVNERFYNTTQYNTSANANCMP